MLDFPSNSVYGHFRNDTHTYIIYVYTRAGWCIVRSFAGPNRRTFWLEKCLVNRKILSGAMTGFVVYRFYSACLTLWGSLFYFLPPIIILSRLSDYFRYCPSSCNRLFADEQNDFSTRFGAINVFFFFLNWIWRISSFFLSFFFIEAIYSIKKQALGNLYKRNEKLFG